ncbi:MAG: hypothetical protein AB7T10_09565 [bacterium]
MFEKPDEKIDEIIDEIEKKNEKSDSEEDSANLKRGKRVPSREITALVVFLLFIASVFYNYNRYESLNAPFEVTDDEKLVSMKNHLYLLTQKISGYKDKEGKLPFSVNDIMIDNSFTIYRIIDDTLYEIECRYENLRVKYISTESAEGLLSEEMTKLLNREEK